MSAAARLRGLVAASHPMPTLAVSAIITIFAWKIGWRGEQLLGVCGAVVVGQLSIGWSNDAFDAGSDARALRREKPTVAGLVTPRLLWWCAWIALIVSSVLSWLVAGFVGGSIHVFALVAAWIYNVALSRTMWSWLPYALAFGAMPLFLYVGLTGAPGPWWTVVVFATVAVSAHLANALKDVESDRAAGIDGLVVRLGPRASALLCWLLLGIATAALVAVSLTSQPVAWPAALLIVGFATAVVIATRSRRSSAMFSALMAVALLDVVTLTALPVL